MLLIATILGIVGATLFGRGTRTGLLQNLKERVFGAASTKPRLHAEKR